MAKFVFYLKLLKIILDYFDILAFLICKYIVKNNNNDKRKVKFVIDHVKQLGGIEYAHEKMIEYRDKALVVLHSFPPSVSRDALEELVRYTTDRKY